eukprot:2146476-Pyramimonas_sp.AAC.1
MGLQKALWGRGGGASLPKQYVPRGELFGPYTALQGGDGHIVYITDTVLTFTMVAIPRPQG